MLVTLRFMGPKQEIGYLMVGLLISRRMVEVKIYVVGDRRMDMKGL